MHNLGDLHQTANSAARAGGHATIDHDRVPPEGS
jgi:hypothetical protein